MDNATLDALIAAAKGLSVQQMESLVAVAQTIKAQRHVVAADRGA